MNLITNRAMEVMDLALDGLSARHKVLSSNVANAMTPGFQRTDVEFEDQLQNIIEVDDLKKSVKLENSGLQYTPNSIEALSNYRVDGGTFSAQTILNHNPYSEFKPTVITDDSPAITSDGNNVNIESEMTELMKNGTKYTALAQMESNMFKKMQEVIKGTV